jgi:hypothetical protein
MFWQVKGFPGTHTAGVVTAVRNLIDTFWSLRNDKRSYLRYLYEVDGVCKHVFFNARNKLPCLIFLKTLLFFHREVLVSSSMGVG